MRLFTDYPFTELGDTPGVRAPIRCVRLVGFDGNKYAKILVDGHLLEVKAGYLYCDRARRHERRMRPPAKGSYYFFMRFHTATLAPRPDAEHNPECIPYRYYVVESLREGVTTFTLENT